MTQLVLTITLPNNKKLTFSTKTNGLIIKGKEYLSASDGKLIYDKTKNIKSDSVICQFSSNTSTLIPALRVLNVQYNSYFDIRKVIESQNNIAFYWKPSRLASYYNRFSTDELPYNKREPVIKKAVYFLITSANKKENFLPKDTLKKIKEPCKLLGFYEGFPIFDASYGMPKLLSRLGIHVGSENIMISTPLDKYEKDIEGLTRQIEANSKVKATYKKNRAIFPKKTSILNLLT